MQQQVFRKIPELCYHINMFEEERKINRFVVTLLLVVACFCLPACGIVKTTYNVTKGTVKAAYKHLPLPTFVRVTNLENNRQILLRVNDRGPFVEGRIIDLSAGAAKKLGF
jgi:rare lipoprotein A (RlpA)-like double-psi beta-barrel protein